MSRTIARMSRQQVPLGRLIGWGSVAVLAAYCLFIGGGGAGVYNGDLRRLSLILATVVIGTWTILAIRNPRWRPRSLLAPGFAAALAALAISTVMSRAPRLGIEYVAWSIILTTLYLLLQRLMASPYYRGRIMAFFTIAAFVLGIAFVVLVAMSWITWWGYVGRIAAPPLRPDFLGLTFGNPSAVMTASVLLTASAVAYLTGGSRRSSSLAIVSIILAALVTLLSGSRAGWLAVALACGVTTILWLLVAEQRREIGRFARSRSARLLAFPLVVGGIAIAVVAGPGIILRASAAGDALRGAFYAAAVRMFEASPVVGLGPGTWAALRVPYTASTDPDFYVPHAHNIYLQNLAEMGLLGVAAGIVVVIVLARLLYAAVRDEDPIRRRVGWCALVVTIYFAAHQVLDFYANAPAILLAFAIPIAWLDATFIPSPAQSAPSLAKSTSLSGAAKVGAIIGIAVIVGSVTILSWAERGAALMEQGKKALDSGDAAAAIAPLSDAVWTDPAMPPYHFALGLALAGSNRLPEAEDEFLKSATFDGLPVAWLNVAAVRTQLGNAAGAQEALHQAMRLGGQQTGVAIGAGVTQLKLGDREAAIKAFVQALGLSPSLAGDSWWTQDPARTDVWSEVYATAFEAAGPSGRFELATETGDLAAAEEAIRSMTAADSQTMARLVLEAWAGDRTAIEALETRARERPLEGSNVNWLTRILVRLGDNENAYVFQRWSTIIQAHADFGAEELRVSDGSGQGTIAGTSTLYYGHYSYRRPAPLDQFVLWLPNLVAL